MKSFIVKHRGGPLDGEVQAVEFATDWPGDLRCLTLNHLPTVMLDETLPVDVTEHIYRWSKMTDFHGRLLYDYAGHRRKEDVPQLPEEK